MNSEGAGFGLPPLAAWGPRQKAHLVCSALRGRKGLLRQTVWLQRPSLGAELFFRQELKETLRWRPPSYAERKAMATPSKAFGVSWQVHLDGLEDCLEDCVEVHQPQAWPLSGGQVKLLDPDEAVIRTL